MPTFPYLNKHLKLRQLFALAAIPVLFWGVSRFTHRIHTDQAQPSTISLRYAPINENSHDIWDPPTPIAITANGLVRFDDSIFAPEEIPTRLAPWVALQPEDRRGVTLQIDSSATVQTILSVLAQIPELSDRVTQQSLAKWGRPGSSVTAIIWFYSDTNRPCFPLRPPPPPPAA